MRGVWLVLCGSDSCHSGVGQRYKEIQCYNRKQEVTFSLNVEYLSKLTLNTQNVFSRHGFESRSAQEIGQNDCRNLVTIPLKTIFNFTPNVVGLGGRNEYAGSCDMWPFHIPDDCIKKRLCKKLPWSYPLRHWYLDCSIVVNKWLSFPLKLKLDIESFI